MKVLHLWLSDSPAVGGGGAGSMYRLHEGLCRAGIDSSILCEIRTRPDPRVRTLPGISRGERVLRKMTSAVGLNEVHRLSSFALADHPLYREADVVNFHGLLGGFLNYLALPRLTAAKPAVLTLRSMWCMTGHCSFSLDCDRWKTGCGRCPYPDMHPPIRRDATRLEWRLKRWSFGRSRLTLVALSRWLAEQCRDSFLAALPIHTIANGVDTEAYRPLDPAGCRALLGIPEGKRVLLFSAVSLGSHRKGSDLLLAALAGLPDALRARTVLLLAGHNAGAITAGTDIDSLDLGYVSHPRIKAIAYSAADLTIMPTRAESFGQVILESMACGTPVAGFRLGPLPELIRPGRTGFLCDPEDAAGLGAVIRTVLGDAGRREAMGRECREFAVMEYPLAREVEAYRTLYRRLLEVQS